MNPIVERNCEALIRLVLARFPADEQLPIRAYLLRSLYGRPWDWVARRVGDHRCRIVALARRGQRRIEQAVLSGRLESREEFAAYLEESLRNL